MLKIDKGQMINVGELKSLLLQGRIMRGNFRLPYEESQVADMLIASVQAEGEYRHRSFIDEPEMRNQIAKAARWLTTQDKFGILLCGTCGNGKTTLMLAIRSLINFLDMRDSYNEQLSVHLIDAREIVRLNKDDYAGFKKIRSKQMLAIDDMGLEPSEVLDYGNVLNPVIDLLSYRYNEQLFTIATTNLKPEEIRQKYGDRIADRFNEMMERIIFYNGSYRSQDAQKRG